MEITWNTKLEVALELLGTAIAKAVKEGYTVNDKELKDLLNEREKMYLGDKEVIDKILVKYSINEKEEIE